VKWATGVLAYVDSVRAVVALLALVVPVVVVPVVVVPASAGCAGPSEDYTPQIHVVPGAAARSLWIASRNVKEEAGVEPGTEEPDRSDPVVEGADEANADADPSRNADAGMGVDTKK
jgi:hypothetical protein